MLPMIMEHPVLSSFIFLAGAAVLYYIVTRIINAVLPTQYEIVAVTDRDETVRYKILWYGLKLCKAEVEYRREVIEYMGKYISPSDIKNNIHCLDVESRDSWTYYARFSDSNYASMYLMYMLKYDGNYKEESVKVLTDNDISDIFNILKSHI
jgi:hypothetical protein